MVARFTSDTRLVLIVTMPLLTNKVLYKGHNYLTC